MAAAEQGEAKFEANHSEGAVAEGDVEAGATVAIITPGGAEKPVVVKKQSRFPVLFERAAQSWWNPKFDTEILENEYLKRSFRQLRRRFRYALIYITFAFSAWCIYAGYMSHDATLYYVLGTAAFIVLALLTLAFTFFPVYRRVMTQTSLILSILLCISCLITFGIPRNSAISEVGTFTSAVEIILMMYTVIPMPLYLCVTLGVIFSIVFEILSGFLMPPEESIRVQYHIVRVLLHCCIHFIGFYICLMTQVRRRSTFLNVGQSILSRRDLEVEKELKKKMINSLMPEKVAKQVMESREEKGGGMSDDDDPRASPKKRHSKSSSSPTRGQIAFRNFHMTQMTNVSILFADIVGFTKMSSNKTAEHLVSLLNDLFGQFDIICAGTGCEKICTLGDCYYSVSGCPDPCAEHAKCCVEMGLSMCVAIQEFDEANNEEVNMRVGVHTGKT